MIIIILVNLVITYFSVFWISLTSPVAFCSATILKLLLFLAKPFWFLLCPNKDESGTFSVLLLCVLGRLDNCYKKVIISISHCFRYLRRVCVLGNCHNCQTILVSVLSLSWFLVWLFFYFIIYWDGRNTIVATKHIYSLYIIGIWSSISKADPKFKVYLQATHFKGFHVEWYMFSWPLDSY